MNRFSPITAKSMALVQHGIGVVREGMYDGGRESENPTGSGGGGL